MLKIFIIINIFTLLATFAFGITVFIGNTTAEKVTATIMCMGLITTIIVSMIIMWKDEI